MNFSTRTLAILRKLSRQVFLPVSIALLSYAIIGLAMNIKCQTCVLDFNVMYFLRVSNFAYAMGLVPIYSTLLAFSFKRFKEFLIPVALSVSAYSIGYIAIQLTLAHLQNTYAIAQLSMIMNPSNYSYFLNINVLTLETFIAGLISLLVYTRNWSITGLVASSIFATYETALYYSTEIWYRTAIMNLYVTFYFRNLPITNGEVLGVSFLTIAGVIGYNLARKLKSHLQFWTQS